MRSGSFLVHHATVLGSLRGNEVTKESTTAYYSKCRAQQMVVRPMQAYRSASITSKWRGAAAAGAGRKGITCPHPPTGW